MQKRVLRLQTNLQLLTLNHGISIESGVSKNAHGKNDNRHNNPPTSLMGSRLFLKSKDMTSPERPFLGAGRK